MQYKKRVGLVVGLKPDRKDFYLELHDKDQPGVRDILNQYGIRNFSIFIQTFDDGKDYLFGYYEYVGGDYEVDMRRLANDPRNQAWLELCDPCQQPLEGEESWAAMKQVYYNR